MPRLRLSYQDHVIQIDRMVHDVLRRRNRIGSTHWDGGNIGILADSADHTILIRSGPTDQKRVRNASISYTIPGRAPLVPDATFKVAASGQIEELMFTNEEITDSAERIDSVATTKVRMLVSRFG